MNSVARVAICSCLISLVFPGCSSRDRAPRARDAHQNPPRTATAPPRPAPTPSASAPSAALSAAAPKAPNDSKAPKDPLLTAEPIDCGPARDNPHGVEPGWGRRDGSCLVCEHAPKTLPLCSPNERTAVTSSSDLKALHGKRVLLRGRLEVGNFFCTKRGGLCACNNRCAAPLRLARARPGDASSIFLSSKVEPRDPLSCPGDEGSVCCPFELDGKRRSVDVIVTGTWMEADGSPESQERAEEARLEVEKLCKLK